MKKSSFSIAIEELGMCLRDLPAQKVIVFSAACSERYIEFYKEFSEKEKWGNFSQLRNSLDLVWLFLMNDGVTVEELKSRDELLEELTPHADDFGSPEVGIAQLAIGCIMIAIEICLGEIADDVKSKVLLSWIFSNLKASICFSKTGAGDIVDDVKRSQFEEKLMDDSRIKKEIELQREDINSLAKQLIIDETFIRQIREKAGNNHWLSKDLLQS